MKMSDSEIESKGSKETSPKSCKFLPKSISVLKEMKEEQLWEYVERLHELLKKKNKKLGKHKEKIKKLLKRINEFEKSEIRLQSGVGNLANALECKNDDTEINKKDKDEAKAAFNFVDEMRQVAQQAKNLGNFVYEPTSGLYYDQNSGYYYNADYGLYYDGNTGCYYKYNEEKNTYEFHSQVEVQRNKQTKSKDPDYYLQSNLNDEDNVIFDEFGVVTDEEKLTKIRKQRECMKKEQQSFKRKYKELKRSNKNTRKEKHTIRKHKRKSVEITERKVKTDIEEGEISTSSSSILNRSDEEIHSNSSQNDEDMSLKVPIFKSRGRFQDIAKKYPPSLRLIVQETNLKDLKVGNLSLITYKGGSLGREGNHDVIIPDLNVSKSHLKFSYDKKKYVYKCQDLGSRNGTILNGQRMSESQIESIAYDLVHGSVLQIGQTKLLCHVHEGNSTCGLCEPGLLIENESTRESTTNSNMIILTHKEQLKKLQKKYGLENEKFVDTKLCGDNYKDRAATRRLKVGSSSDKEKTQIASAETEIASDNKGFKMLSKLGWNKGDALGKDNKSNSGLLEPINIESNTGTRGLGCQDPTAGHSLTLADKRKLALLRTTQERYKNSNSDMFSKEDSSK